MVEFCFVFVVLRAVSNQSKQLYGTWAMWENMLYLRATKGTPNTHFQSALIVRDKYRLQMNPILSGHTKK